MSLVESVCICSVVSSALPENLACAASIATMSSCALVALVLVIVKYITRP